MQLDRNELDKLFHIRKDMEETQTIPLIPVIDESSKTHIWLPKDNKIIKIKGNTSLVEGEYFAKNKILAGDYFSAFINIIFQRYLRDDMVGNLIAIRHDINNLTACIKKMELFYRLREDKTYNIQRFIVTEIEYFFGVCRSLFDLLQLIAKKTWNETELPDSFAKMALKGEEVRGIGDLQSSYGLPCSWCFFYNDNASFFKKIRKYRNDIEHYGQTYDMVFMTDKGICVRSDYKPFLAFDIRENWVEKSSVSIKPIIAVVLKGIIDLMDCFAGILEKEIPSPKDAAPDYSVFMRGTHINEINKLDEYINNDIWYNDAV